MISGSKTVFCSLSSSWDSPLLIEKQVLKGAIFTNFSIEINFKKQTAFLIQKMQSFGSLGFRQRITESLDNLIQVTNSYQDSNTVAIKLPMEVESITQTTRNSSKNFQLHSWSEKISSWVAWSWGTPFSIGKSVWNGAGSIYNRLCT